MVLVPPACATLTKDTCTWCLYVHVWVTLFSPAGLALTVPDLSDLLSLVGAFASSMLAFIFPPLLEIVTFWKSKKDRSWLLLPWPFWVAKDMLILILGLLGFMFGTFANIDSIVEYYLKKNSTSINPC